jgi:hypothetical protein
MPHKPSQRDIRSKRRQRNNENQVTKPAQRRSGRVSRIPERYEIMTKEYLPGDIARVKRTENALNAPDSLDAPAIPDTPDTLDANTMDAPDDSEATPTTTIPIVSVLSDDIDPFACFERTESMEELVKRIDKEISIAETVAILEAVMAEVGSCDPNVVKQVAEKLQRLCESNLPRK